MPTQDQPLQEASRLAVAALREPVLQSVSGPAEALGLPELSLPEVATSSFPAAQLAATREQRWQPAARVLRVFRLPASLACLLPERRSREHWSRQQGKSHWEHWPEWSPPLVVRACAWRCRSAIR